MSTIAWIALVGGFFAVHLLMHRGGGSASDGHGGHGGSHGHGGCCGGHEHEAGLPTSNPDQPRTTQDL